MIEKEISPTERGLVLYETCDAAVRMVVNRFILEQAGLVPTKLPCCTDSEALKIESFIPRAKVGFAQSLTTKWLSPEEIRNIVFQTTPVAISTPNTQIKLHEFQNNFPEWQHFVITFSYLSKLGRVTLNDFTDPTNSIYESLGFEESYWITHSIDPETAWFMMEEIEAITRQTLFDNRRLEHNKMLKIAHFFAAGRELSRLFS